MGHWQKLLKSKHYYFFNITLPGMKIWRRGCSRYLHNHGFFSKWEISTSKVQLHRCYSRKTFFKFSWNAQLCLIFMTISPKIFQYLHIVYYRCTLLQPLHKNWFCFFFLIFWNAKFHHLLGCHAIGINSSLIFF